MKNALILHGISNDHTGNWFMWVEEMLLKKGYQVWVPDLPEADAPQIEKQTQYILDNWKFDENSLVIGHSSGAVLAMGILQHLPPSLMIDKAVLVAGFVDDLGWKGLNGLFVKPFDWDIISKKARKFILFHSDDDPYVPLDHGHHLKKKLNAELIVMKEQGHFNLEKGPAYKQFPELLKKILE